MAHTPSTRHGYPAIVLTGLLAALPIGCSMRTSYREDVAFLRRHTTVHELRVGHGRVAVTPELQGRVITASFAHDGPSLGWMDRAAIEALPAPSVRDPAAGVGGLDRAWLGPEGGPFALFFAPQAEQTILNRKVPAPLWQVAFDVLRDNKTLIAMRAQMTLTNAAGTEFQIDCLRSVQALNLEELERQLDLVVPDDVAYVGFGTHHKLVNRGTDPWTRESGTIALRDIGQFPLSPHAAIIAPLDGEAPGAPARLMYPDSAPPPEDMVIDHARNVALIRADHATSCQLGFGRERSLDRLGSIDFDRRLLTVVLFHKPATPTPYVNGAYRTVQADPFDGHVSAIGTFPVAGDEGYYELESASPAALLAPSASITHRHRVMLFQGPLPSLSRVSEKLLGITLEEVRARLR